MSKNLIILFLLALGLWQCTDVVQVGDDIGREYYPVKTGNYWIYDVTEKTYINQFAREPVDSVTYQVRERVDTVFHNQAGELTYKVIRSRRANASQAWGSDSVVTINKSLQDLRYTRNNLKTVKLVFPPAPDKKWNGNAFNHLEPTEYHYAAVGQPFALGGTTYANTLEVVQYFNENFIELDDRREVYALGVGLIYKKIIDYDYCSGGPGQNCQTHQQFIIQGRKIVQKLRSFGHVE